MAVFFLPLFRRTVWIRAPFRLPWRYPSLEQLTCTQSLQGRHGYSSNSREGEKLDKASAGRAAMAEEKAAESTSALREAVDALLSLGYTQEKVRHLVEKKKSILIRGHKHILPKAAFFQRHGIDSHDFFNALQRSALYGNFLFTADEKQEDVFEFLRSSMKVTNLGKVVGRLPMLLSSRVQTLEAKARLWEELDVPVTGAMLERYPTLLCCSPETIREGVEAVKSTFSSEVGRNVLLQFPCIILRKSHHFKNAVAGLEEMLGPERAQKIILSNPLVLLASRGTMENMYKHLVENFGELPTLKMVKSAPTLLSRSWASIKPKIDFVLTEMGRSKEELIIYPNILSLSLENRLKLRHVALMKAGIGHNKFRLGSLFSISNAAFMERFSVRLPQQ